jgi:uncharacterized protein (DUF697 family)
MMAEKKKPDSMHRNEKEPQGTADPGPEFEPAEQMPSSESETSEDEALSTCRKYTMGAMAAGLVPTPAFDFAAVTAIQLKMLHSIAGIYGVTFSQDAGKSVLASVIGGVGSTWVARGTFGSLIKAIPLVGSIAGAVTMPIIAGAATYAVGRVFIQHFEAGGTLLDFDPEKTRGFFKEFYNEGRDVARDLRRKIHGD